MKILLATDDSEHSKAMAKEFAGRTFAPNTKVRIVSAYEVSPYVAHNASMGAWSMYYDSAVDGARNLAKQSTENAATILRNKNPKISISNAAIEGSPKKVILAEAEKFGADLIIVGSHGRGYLSGFLLGSVSQAVALHAKCSVEIVRKTIKTKKPVKKR